jgi:hypothetical protein
MKAARQRKRIDRRLVNDGERPGQLRAIRLARQAHADPIDVLLQLAILVDTHLPADVRI